MLLGISPHLSFEIAQALPPCTPNAGCIRVKVDNCLAAGEGLRFRCPISSGFPTTNHRLT